MNKRKSKVNNNSNSAKKQKTSNQTEKKLPKLIDLTKSNDKTGEAPKNSTKKQKTSNQTEKKLPKLIDSTKSNDKTGEAPKNSTKKQKISEQTEKKLPKLIDSTKSNDKTGETSKNSTENKMQIDFLLGNKSIENKETSNQNAAPLASAAEANKFPVSLTTQSTQNIISLTTTLNRLSKQIQKKADELKANNSKENFNSLANTVYEAEEVAKQLTEYQNYLKWLETYNNNSTDSSETGEKFCSSTMGDTDHYTDTTG